jgi:hypothetical protein
VEIIDTHTIVADNNKKYEVHKYKLDETAEKLMLGLLGSKIGSTKSKIKYNLKENKERNEPL